MAPAKPPHTREVNIFATKALLLLIIETRYFSLSFINENKESVINIHSDDIIINGDKHAF